MPFNKLTDENISKVIDAYQNRQDIKYFVKLASQEETSEEDALRAKILKIVAETESDKDE